MKHVKTGHKHQGRAGPGKVAAQTSSTARNSVKLANGMDKKRRAAVAAYWRGKTDTLPD